VTELEKRSSISFAGRLPNVQAEPLTREERPHEPEGEEDPIERIKQRPQLAPHAHESAYHESEPTVLRTMPTLSSAP